jgi:hypothetical protein
MPAFVLRRSSVHFAAYKNHIRAVSRLRLRGMILRGGGLFSDATGIGGVNPRPSFSSGRHPPARAGCRLQKCGQGRGKMADAGCDAGQHVL